MPSWLFHNNGDGTFTDVSQKMGIADNPGKSWGVVATDINNDGWMDLFVANDTEANFLFKHNGGRHFEEIGLKNVTQESGPAFSRPLSARGLASATSTMMEASTASSLYQRATGSLAQQRWQPESLAGDKTHRQESEYRRCWGARYLPGGI